MARSPRAVHISPGHRSAPTPERGSGAAESQPDHERIAQRAYEHYEARGREDGRDLDDWLEAERELNGVSTNTTAGEQNDNSSDEAA
jgi:hypothetical protein